MIEHSQELAAHIKTLDRVLRLQDRQIKSLKRQNADLVDLVTEVFKDAELYSMPVWQKLRYQILERDGGKCAACGRDPSRDDVVLHVDHIIPKSKRPDLALDPNNLQVLCEGCNMGKGNRFQTDWRVNGSNL